MPGTGRESDHRHRHPYIQGARHGNPPRQRAHAAHANQIPRKVERAEQTRFRAIHPTGRNHGGEQRHIGKARKPNPGAGCRRAGKRNEGHCLHGNDMKGKASSANSCTASRNRLMPLPMPNSGFNTGGAGFGQAWHICQMQHPWFPSLLLPGTDSSDLTTKLGEFADQDQNAQQSHIDP